MSGEDEEIDSQEGAEYASAEKGRASASDSPQEPCRERECGIAGFWEKTGKEKAKQNKKKKKKTS